MNARHVEIVQAIREKQQKQTLRSHKRSRRKPTNHPQLFKKSKIYNEIFHHLHNKKLRRLQLQVYMFLERPTISSKNNNRQASIAW